MSRTGNSQWKIEVDRCAFYAFDGTVDDALKRAKEILEFDFVKTVAITKEQIMNHMDHLESVTQEDLRELRRKESTYMGSWKKRGGVGAFMMCARKWDRIEQIVSRYAYDIFAAIEADQTGQDGSALAELRDLRRYLLLIESEMQARAVPVYKGPPITIAEIFKNWVEVNRPGTPENGGHHAGQRFGPEEELKQPQDVRLDDGIRSETDIESEHRLYYMVTTSRGRGYHIVDRRKTPSDLWTHLPRLRRELNHKEYEDGLLPEYHGLYYWHENDSKWVMREQFREHWGKE